jgi:hypothetical protein
MNKWLPIAMGISLVVVLLLAMISMYGGNANEILGMDNMGWQPWLITIGLSVSIIPIVEVAKVMKIN